MAAIQSNDPVYQFVVSTADRRNQAQMSCTKIRANLRESAVQEPFWPSRSSRHP
jgi:hypothetical protein